MKRVWVIALASAVALTLLSTAVPGSATAQYEEIMDCERGCEVAAAGYPFPFIIDYPGLSPAKRASLLGAILGIDHVSWSRAAASFGAWFLASFAVGGILMGRIRRESRG